MKKLSAFLLAGLAMLAASCSNNNSTPSVADTKQGEPYETGINIRYVSQDSIYKYYTLADAMAQENQKLQLELISYGNQLQSQAQQLQNEFQQKLQSNHFLNEMAAEAEYKKIQQKLQSYDNLLNQRQNKVQEQVLANAQTLNDSINNFIVDFNKSRKYDAIVYRENVLYINPALDITQEVIDGLNARYTVPVPAAAK